MTDTVTLNLTLEEAESLRSELISIQDTAVPSDHKDNINSTKRKLEQQLHNAN